MSNNNKTIEEQFMVWLTQNVPAGSLSELCLCYPEIEQHCLRIKVLKKPLFETTDLETVKRVQKTITESRIFQFAHKKQMKKMVRAAQCYTAFAKEYNTEQAESAKNETIISVAATSIATGSSKQTEKAEIEVSMPIMQLRQNWI